MKITVTTEDLDKAVAQPWDPRSCLLMQTAIRLDLRRCGEHHSLGVLDALGNRSQKNLTEFFRLRDRFDLAHIVAETHGESEGLQLLREELPITLG